MRRIRDIQELESFTAHPVVYRDPAYTLRELLHPLMTFYKSLFWVEGRYTRLCSFRTEEFSGIHTSMRSNDELALMYTCTFLKVILPLPLSPAARDYKIWALEGLLPRSWVLHCDYNLLRNILALTTIRYKQSNQHTFIKVIYQQQVLGDDNYYERIQQREIFFYKVSDLWVFVELSSWTTLEGKVKMWNIGYEITNIHMTFNIAVILSWS